MCGLLATFFFFGLSQAATVFLSPSESLPSILSPQQANLVLTAHLGLEQFEIVDQPGRLNHLFREREFVGQGDQNALLLLVDETYARGKRHNNPVAKISTHPRTDVVPSTFQPSFSFSESNSESLSSFIKTCNQRAAHVYTYVAGEPSMPTQGTPRTLDIFSAPTPANEAFLSEMATLVNYLDATPPTDRFAALALTGITKLAAVYGTSSEQYNLATETLRATIEIALADTSMRLAVITYAPTKKRSALLTEQSAVKALSSCFSSLISCADATNECSGHGQCTNATRAGQACFVCACTTTVSGAGKVQNWAGEMCERRDVSGCVSCLLGIGKQDVLIATFCRPFVLITGTAITLILLIGGSVSLLYAVSAHELPSILTGGVSGGLRKE